MASRVTQAKWTPQVATQGLRLRAVMSLTMQCRRRRLEMCMNGTVAHIVSGTEVSSPGSGPSGWV